MDGAIVVDKPSGWTSHDVVNKIRRFAGTRSVGHLGTLDPSATGVLPLLLGRATRLARFYGANEKSYEGTIHFSHSTTTYDAEGEATSPEQLITVTASQLEPLLSAFRGKVQQTPPAISAKKIDGRPAYKLARANLPVELKPVEVEIYQLDLLSVAGNEARVRVHCSAGTYIRSIAHDLGQAVGTGAFLHSLRRTQSGAFRIEDAHSMPELERLSNEGRFDEVVIPAAQLLPGIPCEPVDDITAAQIRNGRTFRTSPFVGDTAPLVKAIDANGALVAIGEARAPHLYHPGLVF